MGSIKEDIVFSPKKQQKKTFEGARFLAQAPKDACVRADHSCAHNERPTRFFLPYPPIWVWARASGSRSEASRRRCRGPRAWHQGVPRRSHYCFTGLDGSTGNDSLRYGHCFLIKSSLSLSLHYTYRQARPSLGVGGLVMRCIVSCIAWGIASHWATFVVPPGLRQARYKRVDH
jgi:hypothetical protein